MGCLCLLRSIIRAEGLCLINNTVVGELFGQLGCPILDAVGLLELNGLQHFVVRLVDDEAHSLDVFVHNLLEHRQPNQLIIGFATHLELLECECKVAENQITIFGLDLLNDEIQVLFGVELRRKHIKFHLMLNGFAFLVPVGEA